MVLWKFYFLWRLLYLFFWGGGGGSIYHTYQNSNSDVDGNIYVFREIINGVNPNNIFKYATKFINKWFELKHGIMTDKESLLLDMSSRNSKSLTNVGISTVCKKMIKMYFFVLCTHNIFLGLSKRWLEAKNILIFLGSYCKCSAIDIL